MKNYRGKTKDGKRVEGWYCKVSGKHLIVQSNAKLVDPTGGLVINVFPKYYIDGWFEVIPETVSQSTGLHDKNGKEAYKGDTLGSQFFSAVLIVDQITEGSNCGQWIAKQEDEGYQDLFEALTVDGYEIIGNIHTTPEKEDG